MITEIFKAPTYLLSLSNIDCWMIDLGTEAPGMKKIQSSLNTNNHLHPFHTHQKGRAQTLYAWYCCTSHAPTSSSHHHPSSINQPPPWSTLISEKTGCLVVQPSPSRCSQKTSEPRTATREIRPNTMIPMERSYPYMIISFFFSCLCAYALQQGCR
jgi:hypothetical protein